MPDRPTPPRLSPLSFDAQTDEQRELLAPLGGPHALHIFSTLVRHPGLFRRWLPFAGKLLSGGALDARTRELVILRVAWRCNAAYEWAQHVAIAREAGLSAAEIRSVASAVPDDGWSPEDTAVLRAVDELHDGHCISDATWSELQGFLDEHQLIELPVLAGHYALLAGALNSFGVEVEQQLPALGEA
jgi:4-carboxymuconolactone decarboxylase